MSIGEEISGVSDPFDDLIDEVPISTVVPLRSLARRDLAQARNAVELPMSSSALIETKDSQQ